MSEAARLSIGRRCRVEVALAALAGVIGLFVGLHLAGRYLTTGTALRWTTVSGMVVGFELGFLWTHLDASRVERAGDRVRRSLGIANAVTLIRGGLYAAVAGFAVVPPREPLLWVPALCYGSGVVLDWVDGVAARELGRTTGLGAKLDLAFDTLGFVVAPLVAVVWGRLPAWYLSLSAARYVFRAGVAWRRRRGRPVFALPPSRVRRPLAALQMVFITVALAPVLPAGTLRVAAAVALLPSLLVFLRDYLAVSGRLDGRNAQ